jgi:hypothetical protein
MSDLPYTFLYGINASAVGLLCVIVASTKHLTTSTSKQVVGCPFWAPTRQMGDDLSLGIKQGKFPYRCARPAFCDPFLLFCVLFSVFSQHLHVFS